MSVKQMVRDAHLKVIRLRQVREQTGLGRSTLYGKVKAGEFPAPVDLGPRAVGWYEHEVQDWLASRARAGREAA